MMLYRLSPIVYLTETQDVNRSSSDTIIEVKQELSISFKEMRVFILFEDDKQCFIEYDILYM